MSVQIFIFSEYSDRKREEKKDIQLYLKFRQNKNGEKNISKNILFPFKVICFDTIE